MKIKRNIPPIRDIDGKLPTKEQKHKIFNSVCQNCLQPFKGTDRITFVDFGKEIRHWHTMQANRKHCYTKSR